MLRHASSKVYGCITQLLLMNTDVIKIINSYLTLRFFEEEILQNSWYYLIKNDLLTYEILEKNLLSLTDGGDYGKKVFDLGRLKSKLHDLIAKIATNR